MSQLIGNLVGKHEGPILVCGGAPNLPADLEALHAGGFDLGNAVIVSGNEHAVYAGMAPDYIVVNDNEHTVLKTYQEPRIRKLAPYAKLCSRHWWGDFRGPKMIKANSGITAILWAGIMGGNPIIAAGFELYRGKASYFHDKWQMQSPSMARPDSFMHGQVQELKRLLEHTPLRPVSGELTHHWPKWDPKEEFAPRAQTKLEAQLVAEAATGRRIACTMPGGSFLNAMTPHWAPFAVTAAEAQSAPGTFVDVTDVEIDEAVKLRAEKARDEHLRMTAMIEKVRNSPRSVRRGITDADLMRMIHAAEEGHPMRGIVARTGWPKEQVMYMLDRMGVKYVAG